MAENTPQRQDPAQQPEDGEEGSEIPRFATQDLLLKCQRCGEVVRRAGLFQCQTVSSCHAVFYEKECMVAHLKLSHPGASWPSKPGPSTIVCVSPSCQQKFTCEAAYLAHVDSVHGLHKFFCSGCYLIIQADRKSKDAYKQRVKGSGKGKFRKAEDLTRSEKRRAGRRLVKQLAPKTLFPSEGETENDDDDTDDTDEEEDDDENGAEKEQKKENPGKSTKKRVFDFVGLTQLIGRMRRKRPASSSGPDITSSSQNTPIDTIPPANQSPVGGQRAAEFLIQNQDKLAPPQRPPPATSSAAPKSSPSAADLINRAQSQALKVTPTKSSPARSSRSTPGKADQARSVPMVLTPTQSPVARRAATAAASTEPNRSAENLPMLLTPTQSPVTPRRAAAAAASPAVEPNRPAENLPADPTPAQSPVILRRAPAAAAAAAAAEPNRPAPEPPVERPTSADIRPLEAYPHSSSITYVLIDDDLFPLSPRSSAYYGLDTTRGQTPADKSGAVQRYAEAQLRAQRGESKLRALLLGLDDTAAATAASRRSAIQSPSPTQGQAVRPEISPDSAIETTPPVVSSTTSPSPGSQGLAARRRGYQPPSSTGITPDTSPSPGSQDLPARRRAYQPASPTASTPYTSPEITQHSPLENMMKMVDQVTPPGRSGLKKVKLSPTSPHFGRPPTLPRPQRRAQEPRRAPELAYEDTPEYKEEQRLKNMTPEQLRQAFLEKVEVEKRKLQENAGRKANIFDVFGAIKKATSNVPGGESVLPGSILEEHLLKGESDHTGTSSGRSEEEEEKFFIEHSRKKFDSRSMSGEISAPQYSSKSSEENVSPGRRESPANLQDFVGITPIIPNPYQLPDTPDGSAKASSSDERSSEDSPVAKPPRYRGPEIQDRVSSLPPKMTANPEILKKIDELKEEKKRLLEEFRRREDALDISKMLPRHDYRPPDSMLLGKYYNPRDPNNPKWPEFKIPMSKRERQLRAEALSEDEPFQEEEEPAHDEPSDAEAFDVSLVEYDPKTLKYAHYKDHKGPEYPIADEATGEKRKEHRNKVFAETLKKALRKVSSLRIRRNQEKGVSKIGQLSPKTRKAVIDLSQNVFVREEDIQVSVENCENMKLKKLVKMTVRDVLQVAQHPLILQESNFPRGENEWVDNVFDNGETATARRDENREKPKSSRKEKLREKSRRSASESAAADAARGGLAQVNIPGASHGARPQETRAQSSLNIPWISTAARPKVPREQSSLSIPGTSIITRPLEPREQSGLKKPMDRPRASSSTDDSSGELPKKQMKMRHASVPSSFPAYESFEGERFIPCKKILIRDSKTGKKVKYMFHVYKSETALNDSESNDSETDTADENGRDESKKNA